MVPAFLSTVPSPLASKYILINWMNKLFTWLWEESGSTVNVVIISNGGIIISGQNFTRKKYKRTAEVAVATSLWGRSQRTSQIRRPNVFKAS